MTAVRTGHGGALYPLRCGASTFVRFLRLFSSSCCSSFSFSSSNTFRLSVIYQWHELVAEKPRHLEHHGNADEPWLSDIYSRVHFINSAFSYSILA